MSINTIIRQCKEASLQLGTLDETVRNRALLAIATALAEGSSQIVAANQQDIERSKQENLAPALLKRLSLTEQGVAQVCAGIQEVVQLADPMGVICSARELDKGLTLYQVTVPLGVIAMIFEARPDALVQMASLALKSGNGIILKGGSEALESNRVLARIIHNAAVEAGIPAGWLGLLESREDVQALLSQDTYIDLIIPRGSNSFVRYIMEHTTIPVMGHADGICHIYVDKDAELTTAIELIIDSKTNYPAACNSVETLLIHKDYTVAIPAIVAALQESGVEVRGCKKTLAAVGGNTQSPLDTTTQQNFAQGLEPIIPATEEDWSREYGEKIISIKVVDSEKEGIAHINTYGSKHTDMIVTTRRERAERFMAEVDSASTFWNCSTRFADGFRYGLGAEVGISTSKIHARGPVGLEGLVTYKWRLYGSGQRVEDYGIGKRSYTHKSLPKELR